jgi:NAD(P)H-hydrate epimerase
MQEIDRVTIEELGIPGNILMENAGFEFVNAFLQDYAPGQDACIGVLCGGGNNGGDGFVVARHLCRRGYAVQVFLFVDEQKLKGDALFNFNLLRYFDIEIHDLWKEREFDHIKHNMDGCHFLIDALLGIGFRGTPRGMIKTAVEYANSTDRPIASIDIPAGVDADGGQSELCAIYADTTYTIDSLKYGIVDYPGKEAAGKVKVLDIGFPAAAVERASQPSTFININLVNSIIPPRASNSHKGTYGHLGVMGGRNGFEGASLLASKAALRSGSGLVTLFLSRESRIHKPDEVIAAYLASEIERDPDPKQLEELFTRQNALVLGPGLGVSKKACSLVRAALRLDKKIIIDADGLNCISQNPQVIEERRCKLVLTPHIGEMSRLTGVGKEEIKSKKVSIASEYARDKGLTLVLKDAVTVVATADGHVFMNNGGVAALSKGGSGDVLSGIIGSLMARGLSGEHAAVAGVYLHTESGRLAQTYNAKDSVTAGDLIQMLPHVFSQLHKADS